MITTLVLIGGLVVGQNPPPPARDQQPKTAVGTATVSGIVTTNDQKPLPIRRARVVLKTSALTGHTTTTDDDGRFVFANVVAGTYTMQASKAAWVTSDYGATSPGRPGTPLIVRNGDRLTSLRVQLGKGAVVSGTVADRSGRPVPGVDVQVLRASYSALTGERQFGTPTLGLFATTDDEGNYRAYGLPPGTYRVLATLRGGPPGALMDLMQISPGEITRATADASIAASSAPPAGRTPLVGFAPVYYPGTPDVSRAAEFRLEPGEERGGVNIVFSPVPTARVEAVPTLPLGADPSSLQVFFAPAGGVGGPGMRPAQRDADGRYVFTGVTPADYTISARASVADGTAAKTQTLYASIDLTVDGVDRVVPFDLVPGMTVSGRSVFDGPAEKAPKEINGLTIRLQAAGSGAGLTGPSVPLENGGSFRFIGVPAGKYRLIFVGGSGKALEGWHRRSALAGIIDVLDDGLTVTPGGNVEIVLRYSMAATDLKGQLQLPTGRPALPYTVVAFSEDPQHWKSPSRRVSEAKPATDGTFVFSNMPPGNYLLAAVTDLEPGALQDKEFLTQLTAAAVKVTVTEGHTTVQDLRIR